MSQAPLEIVPCPLAMRAEAFALVLREVAPSQRREICGSLIEARTDHAPATSLRSPAGNGDDAAGLVVAVREGRICGSVWGQRQPGRTAVLWPPRFVPGEDDPLAATALARAAAVALDAAGVAMTQSLLAARDAAESPALESAGFRYLADLMYLSCEAARFPIQPPKIGVLRFEPYDESQRERLVRLIERTYEGTLDCPALGSGRHIDDVVSGYRATGQYRPENWQFVCAQSAGDLKGLDVGVLLLADHPGPRHWELIYMGLTPEARGRGWGKTIALQAQWQAQRAGALRLVLAVDAANLPALAAYRATHFLAWDQRAVFVRFPATDRAAN